MHIAFSSVSQKGIRCHPHGS